MEGTSGGPDRERFERRRADIVASAILTLATSDDADLDGAIVETLAAVAGREQCDRAYITDFHPDGTFETSHEWTAPGVDTHASAIRHVPQVGFPWSIAQARAGRPVIAADLSDLPPEAAALAESFGAYGIRSLVEVPLFLDGQLRWMIGLNRVTVTDAWDAETVETLRRVGEVIGRGLARRAAVEELRVERDRAERAARTADVLLAQINHELRTPLHAILGFAELIDTAASPSTATAVAQIEANGRHLLALVESMLELARYSSGDASTADPRLPIAGLVRGIVADLLTDDEAVDIDRDFEHFVVDADTAYVEGIVRCMVRSVTRTGIGSLHLHPVADRDHLGIAVIARGSDWVPEIHRGFPISRALLAGLGGHLEIRHQVDDEPVAIAWIPRRPTSPEDEVRDQPARP